MPTVLPMSELQRNFKSLVNRCEESGEPICLTRNDATSVVVVGAAAFDCEMQVRKSIERGYEDCLAGNSHPLDKARAPVAQRRVSSAAG